MSTLIRGRVVLLAALSVAPLACKGDGGGQGAPLDTTDTTTNLAPVAAFDATPLVGTVPLDVAFDATASTDADGEIIRYSWDFGDGASAGTAVTSHSFANPGSYTVVLEVEDNRGETATATATVVAHQGFGRTEASGVIMGAVYDTKAKGPLEGALVTIAGVDGMALTGPDGRFRAATPGPGAYRLTIEKEGYGYAQRTAAVEQGRFAGIDPVYLQPLDAAVTRIGPEGGTHASADGEIEVVIPKGATATAIDVRATNLDHEQELPAPLPEKTDFTYCVRLSPELQTFDEPVVVRVANSLEFPPGTQIPVGIYRKDEGVWRHEALATVSADGLWISWQTQHFSAHDINFYQRTLTDNTQAPDATNTEQLTDAPASAGNEKCKNIKGGSAIGVRDGELVIGHDLPTWHSLDRLRGLRLEYGSRAAAPTALLGVEYDFAQDPARWAPEGHSVVVRVGGEVERFRFAPFEGPRRFAWLWQPEATGEDAAKTGTWPYVVEMGNEYSVSYWSAMEFAGAAVVDTGVPGRQLARRFTELSGRLPLRNLVASPLGAGWAIAGLQRLFREPDGTVVILEGATGLTAFEGGFEVAEWPPGSDATYEDEGPDFPEGLAFDALGRLYVSSSVAGARPNRIWRIDPDGTLTHIAGDGTGVTGGDGGPATIAQIAKPHGITVDEAGNLFVAELDGHRVRRIDTNGVITTVAGTGAAGFAGDGGAATDAQLNGPIDVAVDGQGNLFIADLYNSRVRRVDSTGVITTVAGEGVALGMPSGVDVDGNGAVFIAVQAGPNRVWRLDPDGTLVELTPTLDAGVLSVTVAPDGAAWYRTDSSRIERVTKAGVREVMLGGGTAQMEPGAVSTDVALDGGFHQAFDPLGRLVVGSHNQLRFFRLVPAHAIPGRAIAGGPSDFTTLTFRADGGADRSYPDGTVVELAPDGTQTAVVDRNGNRTSWEWQGEGDARRPVRMEDPVGLVTELVYDQAGRLTAIKDPAGRTTRFEVDSAGDLVRIENPDGGERTFEYDEAHRMVERRDPMGETTKYTLDASGGVQRVVLPDGAERTFASQYGGPLLGADGKHFWDDPAEATPCVTEAAIDATGATEEYETNAFGSLASTVDALGAETTIERDEDDQATTIALPDGGVIHNEFDELGRIVRFEDPTGAVSGIAFEGIAVSSVTDPAGVITRITNDSNGNPTALVLAEGTDAQRVVDATYDARGLILSSRDPDGHETTWRYDERGLVSQLEDPLGRVMGFGYDAAGNPTEVTDMAGKVWRLAYDEVGRIVRREDPLGHARTFTYDLSGRTISVENELGATTTLEHDAMGRVVRIVDPLGQATTLAYDAEGYVARADHPDGATSQYIYDAAHRLVQATEQGKDGEEASVAYERDSRGLVLAVEDSVGSRWSLERDAGGRIVAQVAPDGARTEYVYDARGRILTAKDPRGRTTTLSYDGYGLLRRIEDDLGLLAERQHDGAGRVTKSIDAVGGAVGFTYDAAGQLTAIVDELGRTTTYHYDARGLLDEVVSPDGAAVTYTHDAVGRQVAWSDGEGAETRFEHDAAGRVITLVDATDRQTEWSRDALGRVLDVIYHDGSAESFGYDARGRLAERTLSDGSVLLFTYDGLGRLLSEDGPGDEDSTFTYHPDGLPKTAVNPASTISFEWDAAKRLVRRVENGRETTFAYDTPNGRSVMEYPSGLEVTHQLDLRGRLTEVLVDGVAAAAFGWDALNRPTWRSLPGVQTSYGWSAGGELTDLAHGGVWHRAYAYDPSGRIEAQRDLVRPEQSWRYEHDDAGRLVGATRGSMDAAWTIEAPVESRGYVYDAVGDVLQTTGEGATSFTYDALHQVLTAGEAELLHDEAGRLTGDDLYRYEYDARARLVRAVRKWDGGEALGIAYNALGERVLTRVDGVETEHVTHGGMVLEEREGHGEVARRFVYGASARDPLLLETGEGSFSVLQDRLSSLVGLVDATGNLVERAEYGPYGAMTLFDGAGTPLLESELGNPLGFTGQRFDPSVGWLHFRFRSYAPTLMRFVTRDPAGYVAGGNLYEYALSNPVDIVDPRGDCPPVLLGALIGANAAMWLYNMKHACGNPLFGSSYVGTDWNGYEQLKVGAAGAAAGATGAASFGATASVLGAGGMGALETYVTAGVVSSAGAKVAEDVVMDKETTISDLRDAAIYGGATGGLGYGLGRIGSALKLLNAVEDISPKAAAALSEEVLNPLTTKVGYAGRINSESQLLKNLVSTETKGGVQTSAALKGDIDMWSSRQMTQLERVDLATSINKNAGAALIDAHPTHGVLSEMTPANLVVDEIATAQALGKLQYKVIPTKQLFEEGAVIVKPSTGAYKYIDPRQVLEIHNPMPTLGAFMLPLGPVFVE